jgi:hypothetical protein
LNLSLMLVIITMIGLFMERTLQKGVEAHESISGKKGSGKRSGPSGSGTNILDSVVKMLRRR